MKFDSRYATVEDVQVVSRIISQYWQPSLDYSAEVVKEDNIFLVAEYKDEELGKPILAGMALANIIKWNKTGYLLEIAVDKGNKRSGVGKTLIAGLSHIGKKRGIRSVIAETQPSNIVAMDFYISQGFRLCGFNDRYYTNTPKSSRDVAIFFSLDL